ncbi:MAG TPA: hypothetical protein VGM90_10180 [Kofleriaceae bacterium]
MKSVIFMIALAACIDNRTPEPTADQVTLPCLPNLDHQIDIDELPFPDGDAVGEYWVSNTDTAVDLAGETIDNAPHWDWSGLATTDALVDVAANSMEGAWFASEFPRGELVVPLDLEHTVLGILVREDSAISLLGLASESPNPTVGKTLVHYDTPIPLYLFPITAGAHWTSTGVISVGNGMIDGLPFVGENIFDLTVGDSGTLDLPELTLTQAFQLRTQVTVKPDGGPMVTQRSASFVFECFGEVARATSRQEEPTADFHVAREVRRLSLRGGHL